MNWFLRRRTNLRPIFHMKCAMGAKSGRYFVFLMFVHAGSHIQGGRRSGDQKVRRSKEVDPEKKIDGQGYSVSSKSALGAPGFLRSQGS
jgi:hypothetical protein